MYPDLAHPKRVATVWSAVAAVAVAVSLFLWLGTAQGPGTFGWSVLLFGIALVQWWSFRSLATTHETGASCTARVTAYPGPGRLTVCVIPADGSATFEAVIAGGSTPRPPLGTTHKARFRKAGSHAYSVVLDDGLCAERATAADAFSVAG